MGEIKKESQRVVINETLEQFLEGLAARIDDQNAGALAVGSMLTDLVDELGQLIKRFHEKALASSVEAKEILQRMAEAVKARDHERWDQANQDVHEIKGRINAYMEISQELQDLGMRVGGRPNETKH